MPSFLDLVPLVADKIVPPVLIVLGPIRPVLELVGALGTPDVACLQFDVHQAKRLGGALAERGLSNDVIAAGDVWDAERSFETVVIPSLVGADRELKLDLLEQCYHVLRPGGRLIVFSEYERDILFHKAMKNYYGACSETPKHDGGTAFWSVRNPADPPRERRRHRITYRARVGESPSLAFESWPGTFSYGRFDAGSRAMLEVAKLEPNDRVLDLGCGDGSVGILAGQRLGEGGRITFVDSSLRAMKLTEHNAKANGAKNYELMASSTLDDLPRDAFDVVLANPPYYANSEVGRLFIDTARDVLKPNGRLYFVTKMPVQTIPIIVETFGDVESFENRGYTVVIARR